MKFKVDYNTETGKPEFVFEYNTASTALDKKLFTEFVQYANALNDEEVNLFEVKMEETVNDNGTSTTRVFLQEVV
jgi:hypothetical protein